MRQSLIIVILTVACLLFVQADSTTVLRPNNNCEAAAVQAATMDQSVSITVSPGETAWVKVRFQQDPNEVILQDVSQVIITADEKSQTLIAQARLYLPSGLVYETFQRFGYILVFGEATKSETGCLSIVLDDPDAYGAFTISLTMTNYKTAYFVAVLLTAVLAVLFTLKSVAMIPRAPHSVFRAFFRPHQSLKVVAIFFVLELFAGIPGFFIARHVYVTDFLAGNQDACHYDFLTFLHNDGYPQFESFLSHLGYFAAALILVVVWNLENHNSIRCFACADGSECWHWNLGRMVGISAFFLGIRSLGYHYCPIAGTAALDFGGQVVCSLIGTIFLHQQRRVWQMSFNQVVMVIVSLTVMLYVGSFAEASTWFSLFYGCVTFTVSWFLLRPFIEYLRKQSILCFTYSEHSSPYPSSAQKKAAILEIILCVSVVQGAFWTHTFGHLDFGMAVNVTSYGIMLVSLAIELALRYRYHTLSSRAKLTASVLIPAMIASFYFLEDHGSTYSEQAWISRADSNRAFFFIFNKHDLFHMATATLLCAAGLTAMFFPDVDWKRT